jgi:hypothetical protein
MQYIEPRVAFYRGQSAKKRGFTRISPFYENETADQFYGGYDGKTEEEMGLVPIVVGGMAIPRPGDTNPLHDSPRLEDPYVEGV